MTWSLPQPVLIVAVDSPNLPAAWAAEPKWDGFRAQLAVRPGGQAREDLGSLELLSQCGFPRPGLSIESWCGKDQRHVGGMSALRPDVGDP